MSQTNSNANKVVKVFTDYCDSKNYQTKQSKESNNERIDISNLSERTIVKIYHNCTVQLQGKENSLKAEMERFKKDFESNPQSFLGDEIAEIKPCATRYDIMLSELYNVSEFVFPLMFEVQASFLGRPE